MLNILIKSMDIKDDVLTGANSSPFACDRFETSLTKNSAKHVSYAAPDFKEWH